MTGAAGHLARALGAALALAAGLAAGPAAALRALDEPAPPDVYTLPETVHGTVRVGAETARPGTIDTLGGVVPALGACWRPPPGLAEGEITLRLSLRRDGSLQGEPRVTFATPASGSPARRILAQAAFDAVRRCTPLPLTAGLGGAIAGRPIAIRFIYQSRDQGQGV